MTIIDYRSDAEDPPIDLEWTEDDGTVIDMSSATFEVKVVDRDGTTAFTKDSNITGASTLPNARIAWADGELASLSGYYVVNVKATISGRDRVFRPGDPIEINVTPAPT